MYGLFSPSLSAFHSAPSLLLSSELCIRGFSRASSLRLCFDHTMNAFMGRLTWSGDLEIIVICSSSWWTGVAQRETGDVRGSSDVEEEEMSHRLDLLRANRMQPSSASLITRLTVEFTQIQALKSHKPPTPRHCYALNELYFILF